MAEEIASASELRHLSAESHKPAPGRTGERQDRGAYDVSATLQVHADQLESELRDRQVIGKAEEILQGALDLSEEQSYPQLRNASRKSWRRLPDVAGDILRRTAAEYADFEDVMWSVFNARELAVRQM